MSAELVAHGLGSCIALCLFDPRNRVAGLAHVVLPGSDPSGRPNARFAGSALPALLDALVSAGGTPDLRRYQARLAGGANVLTAGKGLPRIGAMNLEAIRAALASADVQVMGEDVGGGRGRTVWFDPRDGGRIRVRAIGGAEVRV
jgi:chemotaxis protein CheD